jgi:hypothetical protein
MSTPPEVTSHYFLNGQRITLQCDGMVQYFLGDHPPLSLKTSLGSTTSVLDQNGPKVDKICYRAVSRSAAEWITPTEQNAGPWTAPLQPIIALQGNTRTLTSSGTKWGRMG